MQQIHNAIPRPKSPHPVLNLGFRIFFLATAFFAVVVMVLWLFILQGLMAVKAPISPFLWHGHEMVFGYGLAVIAGFLLTAVKTWTDQPMPYGVKLLWIFLPWALARLLWLSMSITFDTIMAMMALVFDGVFYLLVLGSVVSAVWAARQKRQGGIVLILMALLVAHVLFYAGLLLDNEPWQQFGLSLGFYLVVAMVLTIGRRVLPFFIEKGVMVNQNGKPNTIEYTQKNSRWLDKLSIIGLVIFIISPMMLVVWVFDGALMAFGALMVAMSNAMRLVYWYHRGIWQKPLLWSLYLSFWGIVVGFLLFFVAWFDVSVKNFALHALAVSAMGMTVLSMMARVSLGHTGRNIHQPSPWISVAFVLMLGVFLLRVLMPLFLPSGYAIWLLMAQILWILAFVLFLCCYLGILTKPRVDGLFG